MNFFDPRCQSGPFSDTQFGLCDDQNMTMACVNTTDPGRWIATVDNPAQKIVTFTAIDKCVINDDEHAGRGRCDAMLTTDDGLYLVELKNQRTEWRTHAVNQLTSTIEFLRTTHDLSQFRHKKAFACNKKSRPFATIDNEKQNVFFRSYGFRLDIQATVLIVSKGQD